MAKLPDKNAVDPLTLRCSRCGAEPGIACDMLDDEFELIHLERIEAAAVKKPPRNKKI
jgi:hypothetical protein